MPPGDTGLQIGEVDRLFPSPNHVVGFNRDGRRDETELNSSSSSSVACGSDALGPTKDVSSRILWGEGDLLEATRNERLTLHSKKLKHANLKATVNTTFQFWALTQQRALLLLKHTLKRACQSF